MNDYENLRERYGQRLALVLEPLADQLRVEVERRIEGIPRIERVAARAKSVRSFMEKATQEEDGQPKYADPLHQIYDQIGIRVITHYLSDRENVRLRVKDYFNAVEEQEHVPESPKEFDYEAMHLLFLVPNLYHTEEFPDQHRPTLFEFQIKTLFQHACAESGHNLAYKPVEELPRYQRRKFAFVAAQAWGADHILMELVHELGVPNEDAD